MVCELGRTRSCKAVLMTFIRGLRNLANGSRFIACIGMVGLASAALAQESNEPKVEDSADSAAMADADPSLVETVVVLGRYKTAAVDIVAERLEDDVPVDYMDAEAMSRVGDSDVAAALRRMPGLTLAEGKYVYVRGLGERYSSAQLNGATVPSPDLTRNVIPLDLFPADIIEAVAVQKGYAPDITAAFGGGNIDIRTKSIPLSRVFNFSIASGWNSESGTGHTYAGGDRDYRGEDDGTRSLSNVIADAIDTYRGSFSPRNILRTHLRMGDTEVTSHAEAQALNRTLAQHLNRQIDLEPKELKPDVGGEVTAGHRWFLGDRFEAGVLGIAAYGNTWRLKERVNRRTTNPQSDFSQTSRTVHTVDLTAALNLGLRAYTDHNITLMSLLLRNTEDDASTSRTCLQGQFNDCSDEESPTQGRINSVRFEHRDLIVNQIRGQHTLGRETLGFLPLKSELLEQFQGAKFSWYYTDASAETHIPNEVTLGARESLDAATGRVTQFRVRSSGTAADYRFSDLTDDALSYGSDFTVPLLAGNWDLEFGGGYDYSRKVRQYRQTSLGLGSTTAAFATLTDLETSEVFSDTNLSDPQYGFELVLGVGGFGTESYIAAQVTEAGYGKFDFLWNETWRFSGGMRHEQFRQLSLPVDWLEYDRSRIKLNDEEDHERISSSVLNEDDYYPSLALTYLRPGFWSQEFQLRVNLSQTVARPDIREMSDSTYIDPVTEARVRGNPELLTSDLNNYDIRAEWFWSNGNNFTVSMFAKDVVRPIETVQGGATEDNILFNFVNAESATLHGVELEWMCGLEILDGLLGDWTYSWYFLGNGTLSDSEIRIPPGSGVGNVTNESRRMTQQSPWVFNLQLGYDSTNTKHSATVVYNAFGERIYFAGISGIGDAFEQPFHSLDFVYGWHPAETLSLRLRLKNLLGDTVEVVQDSVTVIEQHIGTQASVDLKWEL